MARRSPEDEDLRVMPWWLVLVGLAIAILVGSLVLAWLLHEAESGGEVAALRIEAIRTSLAVIAGTGGAIALLFAARQQWIKERAQRHGEAVAARDQAHKDRIQTHQEAVAAADERHREQQALVAAHDATERRVTDLYSNAVNLLGSDRPAVRTAGLYALERLAQGHAAHRQTIVEVVCAYLRLTDTGDGHGLGTDGAVRATGLRVLARHLRPGDEERFWPGIDLDLAGVRLHEVDFSECEVAGADFSGAVLTGRSHFGGLVVSGQLRFAGATVASADFTAARFGGRAVFDGATFSETASFTRAEFGRRASFQNATFASEASFMEAAFDRSAIFDRVEFGAEALFYHATFHRPLSMEHARFAGGANFNGAHFADMALLRWCRFESEALFERARFDGAINLARVRFGKAALFDGATLRQRPQFDQTLAVADARHGWPPGCVAEPGEGGWLVVHAAPSPIPSQVETRQT